MFTRRHLLKAGLCAGVGLYLPLQSIGGPAQAQGTAEGVGPYTLEHRVTPADRQAAADARRAAGYKPGVAGIAKASGGELGAQAFTMTPTAIPHYFGPYANYANSPLPKGTIASIAIDSGGSGYSATPTVTVDDVYGTGSGASAATAVVSNGAITGVSIINGGTGYVAATTTVTFTSASGVPTTPATVGVVCCGCSDGSITSISITSGGAGYVAPVTVTITGAGTGAVATATVGDGVITAISGGIGGLDYSAPIVTITDLTGTGAAATPVLGGPFTAGSGIRKFVDKVAGLGAANANLLGQYIPVAVPDKGKYPGSDYYEIELVEYDEKFHSDLPPTRLRGYRQTNMSGTPIHYMGPAIVAERDIPVRILFTNSLPTGAGGNLFIPVDKSVMGAGMGPLDMMGMPGMKEDFTQNRAAVHLHGGLTPWISDGTPHQWITPAGETTQYKQGVSAAYVPDMPIPGPGQMTYYFPNQQSARLMFYHDHAWGITRLNVYVGEAAPYLITDQVETDLVTGTNVSGVNPTGLPVLPADQIPLVIQDKSFVDATTIAAQDPTWRWGTGALVNGYPTPNTGDLWVPSVYMPAQNPWDVSGTNAFGRWQYGPWFWPPTPVGAGGIVHGPVPNEYYDPINAPWEPPMRPAMPSPSMGMEAFNDTVMVNGTVFPYLEVDPKAYRFRILNAANDRFFSLSFYLADPNVTTADGRTNTEVRMVPSAIPGWSNDGREGGVPDPAMAGPSWIQIGTEGGFLPAPVEVRPQPVNWNVNATAFNVGNVTDHALLLGCAERADVVVDFSAYAGQTLIMYSDAPAAFPALVPQYDYYTACPSRMDSGGAPTTQPGYGPNVRTVMQVRVAATRTDGLPIAAYDVAALNAAFAKTASKRGVFEVSQDPIIVPQEAYNSAYDMAFPADAATQYGQIADIQKTFTPISATVPVTIPFQPKAIHDEMGAAYDHEYGRMGGLLGLEIPLSSNVIQNILLYPFTSPPTDIVPNTADITTIPIGATGDGTQIWQIIHNGVDTHPIHVHLFNAQLLNRVGWDGAMIPPDASELGWKETFRINPLEQTFLALRPTRPVVPFDVPNSIRPIDPSMPLGTLLTPPPGGNFQHPLTGQPITGVTNRLINFGDEYMWHCHILSHEEMDMMHALPLAVAPAPPTNVTAVRQGNSVRVSWRDNSVNETAFIIERAVASTPLGPWVAVATVLSTTGPTKGTAGTYMDRSGRRNTTYLYRVIAINMVGYSGFSVLTMVGAMSTEPEPEPEHDYPTLGFPSATAYSVPSEPSNPVTTPEFYISYMPEISG